jgi:hypothetical protein
MFRLFQRNQRFSRSRTPSRAHKERPLQLEPLEDRLVPTILFTPQQGPEVATYQGGEVLGTTYLGWAPIYTIFWGSYWNTASGQNMANKIEASLNPLFWSSPYLDGLHQYGVTQRAAEPGGTAEVFNYTDAPATVTEGGVKNVVLNAIQHQGIPAPEYFSQPGIYFVITAPGVSYPNASGWHTETETDWGPLRFGWISTDFTVDDATEIISHEVVETMTDPNGDGWHINQPAPEDEIGDHEAENYLYRLNGYRAQAYWSQADQAYLVTDGNQQVFRVNNGALIVNGDQITANNDDGITIDTNSLGGVEVILNGEIASFDPGMIKSFYVYAGSGYNSIAVHNLPSKVFLDIATTGNDYVTMGNNGNMQGIKGTVLVGDQTHFASLVLDDSADTNRQSATLTRSSISGIAPGTIYFNGLSYLSIRGGSAGNSFTINDTPITYDEQTARPGLTTIDTGAGADYVSLIGTTGGLSINGGFGQDIVYLGGASSMASIYGAVSIQNTWGQTTLIVNDRLDSTPRAAVFTDTNLSRMAPATISWQNSALIHGGVSSLTVFGGAGGDRFDFSARRGRLPVSLYGQFGAINGLVGPDIGATWSITGLNRGVVNGITFYQIGFLQGGAGNDTFQFVTSSDNEGTYHGDVTGWVSGGGGSNTLDFSADGGVPIVVYNGTFRPYVLLNGFGTFGFYGISTLVGGSAADVLVAGSGTNLWQITGVNAGQENGLVFSGVENLIGGAGMDIFHFIPTGGITGSLYGQGGGDWLDYSSFSTGVTVNLAAGTATHVFGQVVNVQNVFGGSGNDVLVGNAFGNILMGGPGNDTITGGSGRSVLIGGLGSDIIVGGSSDDIIIGGTTIYEGGPVSTISGSLTITPIRATNYVALDAILAEWQHADLGYASRIADLKNGGGYNGTNVLALGSTVFDDNASDQLTGNAGLDWFFANLGPAGTLDTITDQNTGGTEQVN